MKNIRIWAVLLLPLFPVPSLAGGVTPGPGLYSGYEASGDELKATMIRPGADFTPNLPSSLLVAKNDQAAPGAMPAESQERRPSCSLGTFWDVHFGGYRWMWWAAAGGILIAIHAH